MDGILHVITPSRMAGAETLLARMVKRLEARSHRVRILCSRRARCVQDFGKLDLPLATAQISGKWNPLALMRLARVVRTFSPALLHSHLSTASWWCGWLEKTGGPPSIGHVHGFTSAIWHRRQHRLVAVSQAVKKHLTDQGIAADRVQVLYNPVDPADVVPDTSPQAVRAELATDVDAPVIGAFAHFSEKKGWRELVQAAAEVVRCCPRAIFWFVGEGPLRTEIEHRARELGCSRSIRFTGFRTDVANLMNAADIMALPSHREPFGLVYVEAGLLQKPVIACRAGGAPEVVIHGETGLLVTPHDVASLSNAVCRLLDDRQYAHALGCAGQAQALDRFSWDQYLQSLEEIYADVASHQRA